MVLAALQRLRREGVAARRVAGFIFQQVYEAVGTKRGGSGSGDEQRVESSIGRIRGLR